METTEREAGYLDGFYIARDKLKLDTRVAVSARYTGDEKLNKTALFQALHQLVSTQRALSIQIQHTPSSLPALVRLPSVDLSRIVIFHSEPDTWQALSKSIVTEEIPNGSSEPLWRLHVFQDDTLAFVFHHVIGDGQSGLGFHRALLAALCNGTAGEVSEGEDVVQVPAHTALLPPLEKAMDVTVSWLKFFRVLYEMLAPTSWTLLYTAFTGEPITIAASFDIFFRFLTISREDAENLLKVCRLNGATLTSFLHTAAVIVLSRLVHAIPNNSYTTIATSIPISVRRFTGAADTDFCNHFSGHNSFVKLLPPSDGPNEDFKPDTFPWHAAAEFNETLRQNARSCVEQIGLLKFVSPPYESFFLEKRGKKRDETLEISNLGRFPQTPTEDVLSSGPRWAVTDLFFVQSNAVCGAAIKVMVVGSPDGSVGITVNWTKGVVEDAFAESFVSGLQDVVYVIAKSASGSSA